MQSVAKICTMLFVLLISVIGSATANEPNAAMADAKVTEFSVKGDDKTHQIEMTFDREPGMNWLLLHRPHRLVFDFSPSQFIFEPETIKPTRMVQSIRFGDLDANRSRLMLEMRGPFAVDKVDLAKVDGGDSYKLMISLHASSNKEFEAALADQQIQTATTGAIAAGAGESAGKGLFSIILDPGHGGIDGGAKGVGGAAEKEITLAFAKELKSKLEASGRYNVSLTRDDDRFVRLDERVKFARNLKADLLISIHADTIRYEGVRGATVYTVSDEASDAEAAELADRENLADQVGGLTVEEGNPEVTDILVELIRRETHGFSVGFARQLVSKLSGVTSMIKNPHRHAGFRVLRAPDVPSVLLELGYLSNEKDEAQLLDPEWRNRMADSVAGAIDKFAESRVGWAQ